MPRVRQAASRHRQVGRRTVSRQITANESVSCGTVTVTEDDSNGDNGDNGGDDDNGDGGDGGRTGLAIAGVAAAGLLGVALSQRE